MKNNVMKKFWKKQKETEKLNLENFSYDKEAIKAIANECFFCQYIEVEFTSMNATLIVELLGFYGKTISSSQVQDFCNRTKELVPHYHYYHSGVFDYGIGYKQGLVLRFTLEI